MAVPRNDSQAALFGRIFWMMIGPALLLVSAAVIINSPRTGWHTGADIVFLVVLAGMILGRWLEHRGGDPRNAMGEPAAPGELGRYILVVFVAGATVWVLANLISNYLLD